MPQLIDALYPCAEQERTVARSYSLTAQTSAFYCMPSNLFATRLLGYLVGLVPLVALLLLFRQALPQTLALGLATGGMVVSVWVQQAARKRYPYDFKDPGEWWALGVYAVLVIGMIVLVQLYWQ